MTTPTMTTNPAAAAALQANDAMLGLIYDWIEEAEEFLSSGDDDDDVIVVHDSRGRLIDLDVREGLQRELTVDELNDQINAALGDNAERARRGIDAISERLFQRCTELIPEELRKHPVADQLSAAMQGQRG